ncbi:MAG: hypothetical protein B7Y39_12400 [Bdellovibrio sp. 28-41-41]|nr:MAG: hypothetical protein B7Y39_12400 [Bdellovibrio sp. 28-41-41]
MLHEFLLDNEKEILDMTEKKARDLAGGGPTSDLLKKGLPIFYKQLMTVLRLEQSTHPEYMIDKKGMAQAARDADEPAMSIASGRKHEVEVATAAGVHGLELLRLGYTLSHVVHAYGAMCQSITELANQKSALITTTEFHDLNQCLDVAMAGAVTEYASQRNTNESDREVKHLGFLAHELRNALNAVVMAYELVKDGTVAPRGSTGQIVERGLKRLNELIDRSLTEVRLKVDSNIIAESSNLLQVVDQILFTAKIEARSRHQTLDVRISPTLKFEADQQLFHSALSNLIQNALKYTRDGGRIQVRGSYVGENIVVEVEDECGGLAPNAETELFKPFEQQNENREGLGLGLTIARRAMILNRGAINVQNLPGKGCIFRITLPQKASQIIVGQKSPPENHATH